MQVLLVGQDGRGRRTKKFAYHTVSRPISAGRFRSSGAVRKCSSTSWKPSSISQKPSGPIASIVDRPIADVIE